MGNSTRIRMLCAREILDSRGTPTVEVDVGLEGGGFGRAAVPSGASKGTSEAHELRDGDTEWFRGQGVKRAVTNVNGEIAEVIVGLDAREQRTIDATLRQLDGTSQLRRLGGNAILGVSLATCRASAVALDVPLHSRIAQMAGWSMPSIPIPMVNILSGGLHAGFGMDVQDVLAIPVRASSYHEALHTVARVRRTAAEVMAGRGLLGLLADEGGLSPGFRHTREALELMLRSIEEAHLRPGEDVVIAVDVAASTLADETGKYVFRREGRVRTSEEMTVFIDECRRAFPLCSVEDPLHENDWAAWSVLTGRLDNVQIIGDDLFATNPARIARGIREGAANSVLIKPNQIGTLTDTLDALAQSAAAGYATIVSARSGETEDSFIADLAVGTGSGQIKIGSLRTSERLSKYNQLLRIEALGSVPYAGSWRFPLRPAAAKTATYLTGHNATKVSP